MEYLISFKNTLRHQEVDISYKRNLYSNVRNSSLKSCYTFSKIHFVFQIVTFLLTNVLQFWKAHIPFEKKCQLPSTLEHLVSEKGRFVLNSRHSSSLSVSKMLLSLGQKFYKRNIFNVTLKKKTELINPKIALFPRKASHLQIFTKL